MTKIVRMEFSVLFFVFFLVVSLWRPSLDTQRMGEYVTHDNDIPLSDKGDLEKHKFLGFRLRILRLLLLMRRRRKNMFLILRLLRGHWKMICQPRVTLDCR